MGCFFYEHVITAIYFRYNFSINKKKKGMVKIKAEIINLIAAIISLVAAILALIN